MSPAYKPSDWLPTTAKEVEALGWDYIDVILICGDAYVDHPSFGTAVIGRALQAEGFRVAVVPQPNWRDDLRDFRKLGAPRLFFGVSAGNMDSMVNHYTAGKRLRSDDAYTPAGKAGFRPDYAVTVYTRILKRLFPHVPVVIGGIEASLRRLTHYDYWSDSLKPSVLAESGADLLIYGMGERAVVEAARAMANGYNAKLLRKLRQVAFIADGRYVGRLDRENLIELRPFEECCGDKAAFASNYVAVETESNRRDQNRVVAEKTGDAYVVVNPPYPVPAPEELDRSYELPYTRLPHPRYNGKGAIPAFEMIKFSVNIHRGCFGGCSFCAISTHQGKFINSRTEKSILAEVEKVKRMAGFRGYLSDIGGPSANMYGMGGRNGVLCAACARPSCLHPAPCANLDNDHSRLLGLYRKIREMRGIKKAFVSSGIRYDLIDRGSREDYIGEVVRNHTSGRLKVAPEHTEGHVLELMRKPPFGRFEKFREDFMRICSRERLDLQLVPYLISSHPGCTMQDMVALGEKIRRLGLHPEQVQDFTPTPMTLSSVMFYTGTDPYTGRELYVARGHDEKERQKGCFFDRPQRGKGRPQ